MTVHNSERLLGVNQKLINIVMKAQSHLTFDLCVVEGVRTLDRQKQLYAQGRTVPGKMVTWTMNSKHIKQGDGTGHAVDLAPMEHGKIVWEPASAFDKIAAAMQAAAAELNTPIRWGADWNHNGRPHEKGETDSPHFELV